MLRARQAAFEVSLRALLDRQLRVLRIDVEGVDLLLETDRSGRANWQFAARPESDPPRPPAAGASGVPQFDIERLRLSDVRVAWRDGAAPPRTLVLESLEMRKGSGPRARLDAAFSLGRQRWTARGEVAGIDTLLGAAPQWPFKLELGTDGATLAADGQLGLGANAGNVDAALSARVTSATALTPWLPAGMAAPPLPLELRTTLRRTATQLRADPLHLSLAGQALDGRVTLHEGTRPARIDADLSAGTLDLSKWRTARPAPNPASSPVPHPLDRPLPIDTLPDLGLQLALRIDRLLLPDLPPLGGLQSRLSLRPDRLTLDELRFAFAGGQIRGQLQVVPGSTRPPRIELSLDARTLAIDPLLAATSAQVPLQGGHADLAARLVLSGRTPRELAASASGELLVSGADMTVTGSAAALERHVIANLIRLLVPGQQAAGRPLVVECAVAKLPFQHGIATIDRSIALETREVAVVASGTLNLTDETIRLEFQPRVKKGLGLNPSSLAQLVLLHGPLRDPQVGVDVAGAARGAGKVGVAVATGGLSLLVPRVTQGNEERRSCGEAAVESSAAPGPASEAKEKERPRLFKR